MTSRSIFSRRLPRINQLPRAHLASRDRADQSAASPDLSALSRRFLLSVVAISACTTTLSALEVCGNRSFLFAFRRIPVQSRPFPLPSVSNTSHYNYCNDRAFGALSSCLQHSAFSARKLLAFVHTSPMSPYVTAVVAKMSLLHCAL